MSPEQLIAKLLAQRESWVEVEPGRRVKVRRPDESEMADFRAGMSVELMLRHVVGWEGFTEADILGPSVGASDPVAFDGALFATIARDHMAWFEPISVEIATRIAAHWKGKEATAKN
jgi:hypothetical protein